MTLNGKERTPELLRELQSLSLDRKIQISQARIIEFYNVMKGKVYVSFSGGKDSCVLLHLVRSLFPDVKAVFSNTGLEYPEVVEFVRTVDNIDIIRPEMTFKQVIDKCGFLYPNKEGAHFINGKKEGKRWALVQEQGNTFRFKRVKKYLPLLNAPFKVSDECCRMMKKRTFHTYQKTHGKVRPYVGTLASESLLRQTTWINNGCNILTKYEEKSTPLSFWLDQDIINYLDKYNVPYCKKLYGRIENGRFVDGIVDRTGCIFCLAGVHVNKNCRFKTLKKTHPKLWDYCMRPKEKGGLGMAEVLDWINENIEHENLPMDYGQMPEPLTLDLDL